MGLAKRLAALADTLPASARAELRALALDVAFLEQEAQTLRDLHGTDSLLIDALRAELDALTETERDTKTLEMELKP